MYRVFFFLLFSPLAVPAKTVVIGNGLGNLSVTSMHDLKPGDTIAITPGIYSGGSFFNLNNIVFINNGGLVIFTFRMKIGKLTNITFSGTGASSIANGFVFRGPGNASQAEQAKNDVGGGFRVIAHCEGFRINNADVVGNTNLLDASQTGLTYNGDPSTLALLNTTITNVHMIHASYLLMGNFRAVTTFNSFIDSIDIHDLTVDTSLIDNRIVTGNGIYRCNFYNWNVHNAEVHPFLDQGIIHISGNGQFHSIYVNGGWGYIVRCFASSIGNTVQDVWVYNNIKLNTVKYGLCDVEVQPRDTTTGAGGVITGCNIHVVNNTEGNCADYNDAAHNNPWYTPIFLTPSLIPGFTVEVKNNLGFNMPRFNNAAVAFGKHPKVETGNNVYYATAFEAGLASDTDCYLKPSSPLIDAGTTIPEVITDIGGVSRPQKRAYDIGAREYQEGGTSGGAANVNPYRLNLVIFNTALFSCFLPLLKMGHFHF